MLVSGEITNCLKPIWTDIVEIYRRVEIDQQTLGIVWALLRGDDLIIERNIAIEDPRVYVERLKGLDKVAQNLYKFENRHELSDGTAQRGGCDEFECPLTNL
ncbi:hypothetical protein N7520_009927 [Penicillium odoratum]|uniref:uncharacterized protein n=1 Tax=Penicillium odoratum TaxID=1167516 RepID=UPI002548C9CC|nr:uncharacterized protein N7520_009927 [Penicillium odoratum]KAJ5753010.1 hypothetical protein N7520_009927 [Penicillium odoratum]